MVNPMLCKRCGHEREGHTRNGSQRLRIPEADFCRHCMKVKPVDGTSRAVWVPLAACRTPKGVTAFDEAAEALTEGLGRTSPLVKEAKTYCAVCPVIEQCLAFALRHEGPKAAERWGVQGGLTPKERERRHFSSKMEER
jgi:hypothetical protein